MVGQAVVLSALVSEFCLQEEILAGHDAGAIGRGESFTDSGFEVMLALVGGVDGAKACTDREFDRGRGAVSFPGGAEEKFREGDRVIVNRKVSTTQITGFT